MRDLTALGTDPQLASAELIRDYRSGLPSTRDALLVVLYSGSRVDWRLETLMSRCSQRGVAAVLLEGDEPLVSSSLALARRLKLPVLGAADPLTAHQAFVRVSEQADVEKAALTLRAASHAAEAGTTVEDVLHRIGSALRRPVALVDGQGGLLAGGGLGEQELALLLTSGPGPIGSGSRIDLPDGSLLMVQPVQPAGAQAWLAVRLPRPLPAEADAVASALLAVAPAVQSRLVLARMALERDAGRRMSVLGEVLQRPRAEASRRRALELGWELDGWHTGIRIGVGGQIDLTGRRGEIEVAFEAENLRCVVVEQGDGWTVWTSMPQEPTAVEVHDMARTIRRVHRRLQETLDVHVGVGRPHRGPEGIGQSVGEATDAARLATGRPESGRFLHVDRLGLAQLLLAWTRTDTFQPAARSLLEPLASASGDLVRTLAAYLDAESSLSETAAVLGVHRNTVTARIARIESVLGVDLSAPDDRLALHLACRTALNAPGGDVDRS